MTSNRGIRGLLTLVVILIPAQLAAQEPPPQRGGAQADSVVLRAEREVFAYPTLDRRNPFKPLTGEQSGPRFEGMRLGGIIFSETPGRSVAMLTAGSSTQTTAAGVQQQFRGQSAQLRVGERWGNVRVVEIRRDRIFVEVEEFGLAERREMRLQNRSQGGS
jgi:hypothetical protein